MNVARALLSIAACMLLVSLATAEPLPIGTAISIRIDAKVTSGANAGDKVTPIEPAAELAALIDAIPSQTTAEKLAKCSDVTNLMYIGTREQVEAAFKAAGWAAAELNAVSGLETMRAVAEQRDYKEAPMSTLLLEGRPPEKFQGREVWVCAATHDTGIDFSPENRTFTHKIDSQIDHERAKVVFDLMFADKVQAVALVERPKVPTAGENATGDKIATDGKMAVLLLR